MNKDGPIFKIPKAATLNLCIFWILMTWAFQNNYGLLGAACGILTYSEVYVWFFVQKITIRCSFCQHVSIFDTLFWPKWPNFYSFCKIWRIYWKEVKNKTDLTFHAHFRPKSSEMLKIGANHKFWLLSSTFKCPKLDSHFINFDKFATRILCSFTKKWNSSFLRTLLFSMCTSHPRMYFLHSISLRVRLTPWKMS